MMYALVRGDGRVTITTLYPDRLMLRDGAVLAIRGHSDNFLLAEDPDSEEIGAIPFSGLVSDLRGDSVSDVGEIGFPAIEDEIAKMPFPSEIVSWHRIERTDLPSDESFRDAWTFNDGVTVDMTRAREIHRNAIRAARAPLLAALDVQYQRADETGDDARKAELVVRKNALRNVTTDPAIEAALTPADLNAVWPAALSG